MAIGQELSSIDFGAMIGGPLNAVIRAQANAAQTSVDFIKSVGFNAADAQTNPGQPTMVAFKYTKPVETTDAQGNTSVSNKTFQLDVPILTMLPIPFIRVEETTIDFNAKINSVVESTSASLSELNASLAAKAGWGPFSAQLKTSFSKQQSSSSGAKTERTYALKIHVRAVQDEMPAGLERLLGILEDGIKESEV